MNKNPWRMRCAILLTALLLAFACGCAALGFTGGAAELEAQQPAATEEPSRIADNAVTLNLRGFQLTEAEIAKLTGMQSLTSLDIRDNEISTDTYLRLANALPNCAILWSVPFGDTKVDSDCESVSLDAATDIGALRAALPYLPKLATADLTAASVAAEDILSLKEAYPNVQFLAKVLVCGVEADADAETLDLSQATAWNADELISALRLLPNVKSVNLLGQALSFEEMDKLVEACPNVRFGWSFTFLDVPCSSEDTSLDLSGKAIESTDEVARILRYLPALTALDMSDCGLPNEALGALREQFPNVAIHWRINVGRWSMRTDVTAFSTGKDRDSSQVTYNKKNGKAYITNDEAAALQYCTELVALDVGHQKIDNISFVANMKKLRFLIIADDSITDISPMAGCTELEYVEIFQNYIGDFTPLLSLTKLQCLNCGATKAKEGEETAVLGRLEVLKQMPQLTRLWCIHAGFDKAQIAELQQALPNCKICTGGAHPTSNGWRSGNELYREMQELFELKVLQ